MFKSEEFEIIKILSHEYSVKTLCKVMEVSKSGYYKWLNRKPTERDIRREEAVELVTKTHEKHKSHGYRWTAAFIRINCSVRISDSFLDKISLLGTDNVF